MNQLFISEKLITGNFKAAVSWKICQFLPQCDPIPHVVCFMLLTKSDIETVVGKERWFFFDRICLFLYLSFTNRRVINTRYIVDTFLFTAFWWVYKTENILYHGRPVKPQIWSFFFIWNSQGSCVALMWTSKSSPSSASFSLSLFQNQMVCLFIVWLSGIRSVYFA